MTIDDDDVDADVDDRRRKAGEVRFGGEPKPRVTTAEGGGEGLDYGKLTDSHSPTNKQTELINYYSPAVQPIASAADQVERSPNNSFSFFSSPLHDWKDSEIEC